MVVGDGYCRHKYVKLVRALGLENVVFKGRVSDEELKRLYAASHAIVLPSVTRLEAFGIVLLEAMGAGCVPVVSDLPGLRDTIGDSGLVFDVGDVAGLARTLRLLMSEPHMLESLSRRAHARSKGFNWDITCRGYLAAFADARRQGAVQAHVDPASLSFLEEFRFPSPL
jgi:rhamnosyl/mannosyltransferase